jgi:TniQ protein
MFKLGAPAPIGVGTSACESLSSYVQRLSAANGTYPGQLVYRVLVWIEEGNLYEIGGWCHHPRRVYLGRNNNAFDLGAMWLALLKKITPEFPLAALTANLWDMAFPTRGFLHATLRWCPLCLATDGEPYHRLLWALQPVTDCPVHRVALACICPRCGRSPPVLHDRSMTVICPYCGADLRRSRTVSGSGNIQFAVELGNVIAHYGDCKGPTEWNSHIAVRSLGAFRNIFQPAQLARAVGTSKLTAWYWWNGRAGISLPMALHVYSRLGCSFAVAVTRNEVELLDSLQVQLHLRGRKLARRLDWRHVHGQMTAILQRPLANAPTFLAASCELGIAQRTIRVHFPHLARRISGRHSQRLRSERKQRETVLENRLKEAVRALYASGCKPRQFLLERVLRQPGLFNRRFARRVLADVLHGS